MIIKILKHYFGDYRKIKRERTDLKYTLGYSNLTFDLWMILHRKECNGIFAHKKAYLKEINKAFSKNFIPLDKYKEEKNFKNILENYINLEEVEIAIKNAKKIREAKEKSGSSSKTVHKFKYYDNNPDLTIHECVEKILIDSGILKIQNRKS